jgi:hypothetical protein
MGSLSPPQLSSLGLIRELNKNQARLQTMEKTLTAALTHLRLSC